MKTGFWKWYLTGIVDWVKVIFGPSLGCFLLGALVVFFGFLVGPVYWGYWSYILIPIGLTIAAYGAHKALRDDEE